jgi:RNA polymerase sigma-70 factor (ECF subfamily)
MRALCQRPPAREDTAVRDTPPLNDPHSQTSLTLLERLRCNEPEAWRTMVHLYTPLVYHWCAASGVRGADAEDVAQEVFRAAAAHLPSFRHERPGDTFRGWLRVITRNMVLLHFRKAGRQPLGSGGSAAQLALQAVADPVDTHNEVEAEGEVEGETAASDDAAETSGLHRRALDLVRGQFEARTWQMFWQTFIDERPPAEVAAELGVTPAAVRKAKSRVLHRLKQQFTELLQ